MSENRDQDLEIISQINQTVQSTSNSRFVLTGSHAFELLTGVELEHGDIDGNVFSHKSIAQVRANLKDIPGITPYKSTVDRLEFDLGQRRVELCLYPYELPSNISTTHVTLVDSQGKQIKVEVKSLPYTIATWAIRISGTSLNPKRALRESDLKNFAALISVPYQNEEVINAMRQHIQMPTNISAEEILSQALLAVKSLNC